MGAWRGVIIVLKLSYFVGFCENIIKGFSFDLLHGAQRGAERKLFKMLDIGGKAKQRNHSD
jgi:hypothetical protein